MIPGATSDQLAHVLHLLSTDPAFREQMLGDPVSALAPHGIKVDQAKVPAVRHLPPMAEVAKLHAQFKADPQNHACVIVFIVIGAKSAS